jgi:hypothetical protein
LVSLTETGTGCAAVQSSRLASGAVAAVDTLEGLGAAKNAVEGGVDMVNNGVNFENSVKVASGLLLGAGLANKSCFTEGTQIVVGAEYDENDVFVQYVTANIEDINVGDLVYSYDTITGEVSQKEVTATFVRESDHLNYLAIVDENGNEQVIETTDSHPFWVVTEHPDLSRAAQEIVTENGTILYHENLGITENGYWVEAKDLRIGDVFIGANGECSTLLAQERVAFADGVKVYNFTVDGNHNYFVIAQTGEFGQTSILAHNACPNPNGRKGGPEHQAKVNSVIEDIKSRGLQAKTETVISIPNGGLKTTRYADVTAWKNGVMVEIHQIGKTLQDGLTPVIRERHAINDILFSKRIQVKYHSYD